MLGLREEIDRVYEQGFPKKAFPKKGCKKFRGALTVEVIREHLEHEGFPVSARDVFIKGLPVEIDLLIPKGGIKPDHGILFKPEDVLVVFEIKFSGNYGEKARTRLKEHFEEITASHNYIRCAYVTVIERFTYKWKIDPEFLGPNFGVFTLNWRDAGPEQGWDKLLAWLRETS